MNKFQLQFFCCAEPNMWSKISEKRCFSLMISAAAARHLDNSLANRAFGVYGAAIDVWPDDWAVFACMA